MWEPYLLGVYPLFLSGCVTQSPRNIIIVFTSFKRLKVVELMLTTYKKYKNENWELYVFTDLRKKAADERFNDSVAPAGANLVVVDRNIYKHQKFWEHEPRAAGVQNIRMIIWRDWLRENNEEFRPSDRIILTDEDIFFNGNPFGLFDAYPKQSLFFFSEITGFLNKDGWNEYYIKMSTPSLIAQSHVFKQQVYCIGVAMGTVSAIRQFLERVVTAYVIRGFPTKKSVWEMTDNSQILSNRFIDQGVTNILIHTGRLNDLGLELIPNEQPWVAHLTSQTNRENVLEFALNRTIIHQYKYVPKVKEWILNKYGLSIY